MHNPPPHQNRLASEQSPYLLQHAANPVDWYPWGDEAFDLARTENKPVFLSIGYATCHWCHVMERESFEDMEVAQALNRAFVCIKVDREERPDIDNLYMTACQALTGGGGWPLTAILTPDRKPFFVGTYFPKHGRAGRPGLLDVIRSISQAWQTDAASLNSSAEEITRAIMGISAPSPSGNDLNLSTLETAYQQLSRAYDSANGGFSFRPKFPTPHAMLFLLRYHRRHAEAHALEMVQHTLRQMRAGGIFDHIGLGFHRYSTDEHWLVPHFEKMLYDQALLVLAYLETFQVTGDSFYANTAREILEYVLRDMTAPNGGFYSAEDADSEGVEGKFYLWSVDDVESILGDEAELFLRAYNFGPNGNFAEESTGELSGTNIPHRTRELSEIAADLHVSSEVLQARLADMRHKLFVEREKRTHPLKDDKILTDWNGLMIAATARAARVLNDRSYADAATQAVRFVLDQLRDANGRLLKRFRNGHASLTAMLDDYAFMAWGLIELFETTGQPDLLREAIALAQIIIEHFSDAANGGFYLSPDDGEPLPIRAKESYDGAIPSGNSFAALVMLKLSHLTGDAEFAEQADRIFASFAGEVAPRPSNHTFLMMALDFKVGPVSEIVLAGDRNAAKVQEMLQRINSRFLPNSVLVIREEATAEELARIVPGSKQQSPVGDATVFICQNFACQHPITEMPDLERQLPSL